MANNVCRICHKKVKSFSIQIECGSCISVYHAKCINWSRNDVAYSEDWYCNKCLDCVLPFHHIEDLADFKAAIAENFVETNELYKNIDNMIFNPFEINDHIETPMTEIDPDFQFFTDVQYIDSTQCDYYLEDKFISKISSDASLKNSLSLFHTNIRSLPKHIDALELYLESLQFEFSFIGLTETRLNEYKEDLYSLKSYLSINEYRKGRTGGGVSLLVRNGNNFIRRCDL